MSTYNQDSLPNAAHDAQKVAAALQNRGFDCHVILNVSASQIDKALADLKQHQSGDEICLIYFSGHGVEHHGAGYILPQDFQFPISVSSLQQFAVSSSNLADALSDKKGAKIIVLDACRNSPHLRTGEATVFERASDSIRNEERAWDNLLIAYSTSSGDTAADGPVGGNSYFCDAFCRYVQRHDLNIDDCIKEVGQHVMNATQGKQRPWYYSSLNKQVRLSDLNHFAVYNSYNAPLDVTDALSMSTVTPNAPHGVYVTGSIPRVFAATLDAIKRVTAPPVTGKLIGAAPMSDGLAMLVNDGSLVVGKGSQRLSTKVDVKIPFGLFVCGKHFVVHGSDGWAVYTVRQRELIKERFQRTRWPVQAGISLSHSSFCLAGSAGHIIEVQMGERITWRAIHAVRQNINALVAMPKERLLCGGDGGLLVEIDLRTGATVADYQREQKLTLPSTRRESLMNLLDDDRITRFLTRPESILPEIVEHLEASIEPNRIMCADRAPLTHVIACGSNEGIINLIDTRDGQTFQKIDTEAGRGIGLAGLRFMNDNVFVALSDNAVIRHYAASYTGPEQTGPFLNSKAEDDILAEQGFD